MKHLQETIEYNGKLAISSLVIACVSLVLSALNVVARVKNETNGKQMVGAIAYSNAAVGQPDWDRRFSGNSFQEAKLCGTTD